MSRAARTVFVFGIYMVTSGLVFMCIPNVGLPLFGLPKTGEPWVRVAALLVAILGYYYIVAARNELLPFFRATVLGRVLVLIGFVTLVAVNKAPVALILTAVPDQLGAVWTWRALLRAKA